MIDFLGINKETEQLNQERPEETVPKVMEAIEWFFAYHSKSPTVREIQARAGISTTSLVAKALDKLEEMGYIKRNPALTRRNIQLTDKRWFF